MSEKILNITIPADGVIAYLLGIDMKDDAILC